MTPEIGQKIDQIVQGGVNSQEAKNLVNFLNQSETNTKNLDTLKKYPKLVSAILGGIEVGINKMVEESAKDGIDKSGDLKAYKDLLGLLRVKSNSQKNTNMIDKLMLKIKYFDKLVIQKQIDNINKQNDEARNVINNINKQNDAANNINLLMPSILGSESLDSTFVFNNEQSIDKKSQEIKENEEKLQKLQSKLDHLNKDYRGNQVSKNEYLKQTFDSSLFVKAEYEKAFDQCFLEEYGKEDNKNGVQLKENSPDSSFVNRIAVYSKALFPEISGVALTREAKFIIAGNGKNDNGDLQNLYPAGTKLVEVTAKIGESPLYKHGDVYYTLNNNAVDKVYVLNDQKTGYVKQEPANKDGLPKENHKIHTAVIAFGENDVLDNLRAKRFQEELDKGESQNDLFKNANNIIFNNKPLDLSAFEQRGAGAFKLWLSGQKVDDINSNLPKIFGAVDKLDGKFLDALVDVVLEKGQSNQLLLSNYINFLAPDDGSVKHDKLGSTKESQSKTLNALKIYAQSRVNGNDTEKKMSMKIFALSSLLENKTPPKTFQEGLGEYAKVLFEHPVGKMILSMIDSLFGGKGRFLRWVNKRDNSGAIAKEINEQFKKNYSLTSEQMEFFDEQNNNFNGFDEENKININNGIQEYNKGLGNIIKNFYKIPDSGNSKMDLLATKLANQGNLLDPKVLLPFVGDGAVIKIQDAKGHPLKNVDGSEMVVNHNEVFVTVNQGFKVNPNITADTLKKILQDARIQSAVINANNTLLRNGAKNEKGKVVCDLTGDMNPPLQLGIQSEKDYAKFLTAYLMGGSKGEGKFQYVITENNLSNAFPPVENSKNGGGDTNNNANNTNNNSNNSN